MSEYQYYEFQAVDRSLTEKEMVELRTFSSRADITPNSFVNDYSWGSFKGDEDLMMEEYFDAFLYYANWGTHILKLRLPSELLDIKTVQSYCKGGSFSAHLINDKVILDFQSEEDGHEWEEDIRLSSFLSLRTELSRGDLRCLYLGWLSHLGNEEYDDEEIEPPVPPGLAQLTPGLINLAEFLRIDRDVIDAASKTSLSLEETQPNSNNFRAWLASMSPNEKENLLVDILEGVIKGDQIAANKLVHRFNKMCRHQQAREVQSTGQLRTIAELLKEAEDIAQERERLEAETTAAKQVEKQRLFRLSREKRMNEITGQEFVLWNQIESLVSEKKASSYNKAIELLIDLRDFAAFGDRPEFLFKFHALKKRHSSKSAFIGRLRTFDLSETSNV